MITKQKLDEFFEQVFVPSTCEHNYKLRNIQAEAYMDWDRYECQKCHHVIHISETAYRKLKELNERK